MRFFWGYASKDGDGKFLACNKPDIYIHLQFEEKSYILDQMDTLPPPGGVVDFFLVQPGFIQVPKFWTAHVS